jgi:hypothetical protein
MMLYTGAQIKELIKMYVREAVTESLIELTALMQESISIEK